MDDDGDLDMDEDELNDDEDAAANNLEDKI